MSQYQTVIYQRSSGSILRVLPNQYISNKKHLARLAESPSSTGISFIYFPYELDIDLSNHHVSQPSFPGPAYLTDSAGTNIAILSLYDASKKLLIKSKTLLYSFEGGLGDYVNQGNVISEILSLYPDKEIHLSGRNERFNLISCFPNFERVSFTTKAKCVQSGMAAIDFSQISSFDYNYPPFGKRGVYASLAGIDPSFTRASFNLPVSSVSWADQQWSKLSPKKKSLRISLHTRSGEPNSKTWPWIHTLSLIDLLRAKYSPSFALFGGHGQESLDAKDVINGIGFFDWVQVASLIKTSDLVICIDSAIMHIAHHLDIPTLSLWGPTAASFILPKTHGTPFIESKVSCHPCGNYSCAKGLCMLSITPAQVINKVKLIVNALQGS
ncbi:hypothetical protein ES703_91149 [subsurface metagenome]